MANNIVALNLNGNEYNFRPLYSFDDSFSLVDGEFFELDDFSVVDGASFLIYINIAETEYTLPSIDVIIRAIDQDNDIALSVCYGDRYLRWSDLKNHQIYEIIYTDDCFHLNGSIPYSAIKYRDNKNQLQEKSIGNGVIDLSSGVYYATTSATATRVANTLTLTDVNGDVCEYNGSRSFDLSDGVNYAAIAGHASTAEQAEIASTAGHASTADSAGYAQTAGRATNADYAEDAGYADFADIADSASCASRLKECGYSIPGEHISGEYCHICSIDIDYGEPGHRDNYSILFTGYGYEGVLNAPWGGILYFEWNDVGAVRPNASAKWMSLTRADLSNSILLTYEDGGILHVWFAYSTTYASADVTLIKGSNVNFDGYTTTSLTGTTIATSTFDGGGSGDLNYQILNDSGSSVWESSVDLENGRFIFRPGPNIDIYPTHALDSTQKTGVFIKLSDDFTQAFTQLQQYVELLQYTVANQKQQIADLKSVLTEITTGKTWNDNIWGSTAGQGATSGIMTNEHGFIDIHPL